MPDDSSVLPFPPTPMDASVTKPRLQDSKMKWPKEPQRLQKDAPNILVILIDDVGFGIADTFGHPVEYARFRSTRCQVGLRDG